MSIAADLLLLAQPIGSLSLLPGNPRKGDVDAVAASLRRFGQRKPIVARASDRVVIAGNHTLQAARSLGWSDIAVVFTDDDEATAKAFALADNRTGDLGAYDDENLAEMIAEVQAFDISLLTDTGWDKESVDRLLGTEVVPDFEPVDDELQARLDQRVPTMCPQCAFEWRVGPRGDIQPV